MSIISRGFKGRRSAVELPPGQYETKDFPVLTAGPTPRVDLSKWAFTITGAIDAPRRWSWEELLELPGEEVVKDIHCVTKWSKLRTRWRGVSVDTLMEGVVTGAGYAVAHSYGGYTTNLPFGDLLDGKAWIAYEFEGAPLDPEHGGPARLLVPHLYLWKSAKWVRGLRLTQQDEPGFWEAAGYHDRGDPWLEQRYQGD